MKRVLLISYVFPPEPSPGALRPGYLARYLREFGWDVTVLTHSALRAPFDVRVRSTEPPSIAAAPAAPSAAGRLRNVPFRRVLRAAKESVLFPDHLAPWIPRAIAAGRQALAEERFDAILSTALPASVHVVAAALAKQSHLPWIADYRDPWAGNAYIRRGPVRLQLEHSLERRLIRHAAGITTISESIAALLGAFHARSDVRVIPNAYDRAEWDAVPQGHPAEFSLCYTGSMYDGKRSPDLLFGALAELRRQGDPAGEAAQVHFYGPNSSNVAHSAAQAGVSACVHEHGAVPRAQAMRAQRDAASLLLFLNMDPSTAHEMGSKYLEYVGAGRHMLAFGPAESVLRGFIERNALGWFASTLPEAIAAVRSAYAAFSEGRIHLQAPAGAVPSSRDLARSFAEILDSSTSTSIRSKAS